MENKYESELPDGLLLKIANPCGIIIMGRDVYEEQYELDFEIIRRKYKNVVAIITYDNLIKRLQNIIAMLEN